MGYTLEDLWLSKMEACFGGDVFRMVEAGIMFTAIHRRDEFLRRRDRIAALLYSNNGGFPEMHLSDDEAGKDEGRGCQKVEAEVSRIGHPQSKIRVRLRRRQGTEHSRVAQVEQNGGEKKVVQTGSNEAVEAFRSKEESPRQKIQAAVTKVPAKGEIAVSREKIAGHGAITAGSVTKEPVVPMRVSEVEKGQRLDQDAMRMEMEAGKRKPREGDRDWERAKEKNKIRRIGVKEEGPGQKIQAAERKVPAKGVIAVSREKVTGTGSRTAGSAAREPVEPIRPSEAEKGQRLGQDAMRTKMEATRRMLGERYRELERAKEKRRIRMIDPKDLPPQCHGRSDRRGNNNRGPQGNRTRNNVKRFFFA